MMAKDKRPDAAEVEDAVDELQLTKIMPRSYMK